MRQKKATALEPGQRKRVCRHDASHVQVEKIAAAGADGTLFAGMSAKGKKGLTVRWSRVKGAEGYDVFFAKCNTSRKIHTFKKVKTLKVGRISKIRAKVKKLRKNRKLISKKHAPRLRYLSTDQKIAVVTRDGRITAKGRGTCRIYVYAANGVYKTVRVTVK